MFDLKTRPIITACVAASLSCIFTSCKKPTSPQIDANAPVEIVVPEHGAYTGAFMDFGDEEDDVTLEMIEEPFRRQT